MNTPQDSYHVDIQPGVLITCDSAALQILKFLDRHRAGSDKFIIKEVDDTHLFVHGRYVEQIKDLLQEELEKNTYSQDPEM